MPTATEYRKAFRKAASKGATHFIWKDGRATHSFTLVHNDAASKLAKGARRGIIIIE